MLAELEDVFDTLFSHAFRVDFRDYNEFVTRAVLSFLIACTASSHSSFLTKPTTTKPPEKLDTKGGQVVEEPPEEDAALKPQECTLNPLEAERDIRAGNFYFKAAKYAAALGRFKDAICWGSGLSRSVPAIGRDARKTAQLELGPRSVREKYVTLAPDAKNLGEIKKKITKLPPPKN